MPVETSASRLDRAAGVMRPLLAITPGPAQQLALTEAQWKLIKGAHSLVASVEPAASVSVAPTTPLLYSGLCINLKGS